MHIEGDNGKKSYQIIASLRYESELEFLVGCGGTDNGGKSAYYDSEWLWIPHKPVSNTVFSFFIFS